MMALVAEISRRRRQEGTGWTADPRGEELWHDCHLLDPNAYRSELAARRYATIVGIELLYP